MAEVHRPAVLCCQAAVVEDLQEDVPDVLVRFLELIQQHDGERLPPDGRDKAGRWDLIRRRLREQAL